MQLSPSYDPHRQIQSTPFASGPHGEDVGRISYTRTARRLLYGEHREIVVDRLIRQKGAERTDVVARLVDLSTNPLKRAAASQSTLYDLPPTVAGVGDVGDVAEFAALVSEAGLWSLMPRTQRDTLALRQMFVLVSIDQYADGPPELVYEPIPPDLTVAEADPGNPGRMARLFVARRRQRPELLEPGAPSVLEWFWDDYDLRDPKRPAYRIWQMGEAADGRRRLEDMTQAFGIDLDEQGWLRHARTSKGVPVMPGVKYDAQRIPALYDPYENLGLVEGSLNVCGLKTDFLHVMNSSSWRQRFGINVQVPGASEQGAPDGTARRMAVQADPSMLLILQSIDEAMTPSVGTFEAPTDPVAFLEAIHGYERDIIADSGLRSPSVQKMAGDPRSGQALEVDRDDERKLQERYKPSFRRADQELLRVSACMLNRATASGYPEGGYVVTYQGIPESPAEKKAKREHLTSLVDAGLLDPVDAYIRLNPGTSPPDALEALLRIRQTRQLLAVTNAPAAAATSADTTPAAAPTEASAPTPIQPAEAPPRLNGAQIVALLDIVARVTTGELTRPMAVAMLQDALGMSPESVTRIMADVDNVKPPLERVAAEEITG